MIKRFLMTGGMKGFSATLCGLFLILIFSGPAHGLPFKKSRQRGTKASIAETSDYRIIFSYAHGSTRKDPENPKVRWVELSYKYADLEEPPGQRFAGVGGGKVRFLDQDGFVLASDVFSIQDLESGDTYGFLGMEENRARQIVNADVVALRSDELSLLKKTGEEPAKIPNAAAEMTVRKIVPIKKSPAPLPSSTPTASPTPPPPPLTLPPPSATTSPDSLERGGASNEDVQKVLKAQQENPETKIPPSASTIDLPMDEDTGETQEENKSGVIIKQTFL